MNPPLSRSCCACGVSAPSEESLYVLIGEHGWRPLWSDDAPLGTAADWLCPPCWQKYKASAVVAPPSSVRILAHAATVAGVSRVPPVSPGRSRGRPR